MSSDSLHASEPFSRAAEPATEELMDRLTRFDGPPEQFLAGLLALQCRVGSASGGALLRPGENGRPDVLAVHPPLEEGATAPAWLAEAVEAAPQAASRNACVTRPVHDAEDLYGQPARRQLVLLPLQGNRGIRGVGAFLVEAADERTLRAARERLALTASLLNLYEMRLALAGKQADLGRLRKAMETLAAFNAQGRFAGAAMALVNEVATRWDCDRVSLGFLKGRYVRVRTVSHTEKFSRKMKLVQDTEAAMEECLDQDVEVIHPAPREATYVSRSAAELSRRHGPTAVLSVPIRHEGEPVALMTLERPAEKPFAADEVEALRLTCDLCTARLVALERRGRWFGARAAAACRRGLAKVLGPEHTWIKLAVVGILGAAVALAFLKGTYRVDAPFVLETTERQVVPAPFAGYLKAVYAEPDDAVVGARGAETWLLESGDVLDWPRLVARLAGADDGAAPPALARLRALLGPEADAALRRAPESGPPEGASQAALLAGLNALLDEPRLYDPAVWPEEELAERAQDLVAARTGGRMQEPQLRELNRSLLASALPEAIAPPPTVLATLETSELRLELAAAKAERLGYLKEAATARRDGKEAEAQIALDQAAKVAARMDLLKERIGRATVLSSMDGRVVKGDLKRRTGAAVETGEVLFEVAPLETLRAELAVPEDLIAEVEVGQEGELATTGFPEQRIGFVVERIHPVAEVVKGRNVFKVRVRLKERPEWMRPGLEGVAKVDVEERLYVRIWTRRLTNWVRMKLWI
jgi:hypothetical protein